MHRVVHIEDPLRVPSIPSQYHDGVGDDSCNSAGWGGARAPASDKISRSVSLGLSLKYPGYPITTKFESAALSLITTFLRRVSSHTTSPISFSVPSLHVCASHGFRTRCAILMFRLSLPDVFLLPSLLRYLFDFYTGRRSTVVSPREKRRFTAEPLKENEAAINLRAMNGNARLLAHSIDFYFKGGWKRIVERGREKQKAGKDIGK